MSAILSDRGARGVEGGIELSGASERSSSLLFWKARKDPNAGERSRITETWTASNETLSQ